MRVPWDKYETAILIDAYLKVKNEQLSQSEAVKEVSLLLRRRATHLGVAIDSVFRNENGIGMQIKIIGGLIDKKPSGLHSATKIFHEMVDLYKTDRPEYEKILFQARGECVMQQNVQDSFFAWLSKSVSEDQLSEFYIACRNIEFFCLNNKILTAPLFETIDLDTIKCIEDTLQTNRMFQFKYFRQLGKMKKVIAFYKDFIQKALLEDAEVSKEIKLSSQISQGCEDESKLSTKRDAYECIDGNVSNSAGEKKQEQISVSKSNQLPVKNDADEDIGKVRTTQELSLAPAKEMEKSLSHSEIDTKVAFVNWMLNSVGLAIHSAQSYSSAVNVAGQYSMRFQLSEIDLFSITDSKEIESITQRLLKIPEFSQLNDSQHNRYRAALSKYWEYCKHLSEEAEADSTANTETISVTSSKDSSRTKCRSEFISWAQSQGMTIAGIRAYLSDLKKCSDFAFEHNYISEEDFFLVEDPAYIESVLLSMKKDPDYIMINDQRGKRLNSAMQKLIAFRHAICGNERTLVPTDIHQSKQIIGISKNGIKSEVKERYARILQEKFEDGFRPEKAIDRNRFRMYYTDLFGSDISEDDESLVHILLEVGTLRDERIFVKDTSEQIDLIEEINETIMVTFAQGASCIYLGCIFEKYKKTLAESLHIYNVESFENVLFNGANRQYFKRYNFLFTFKRQPEPSTDVVNYMKGSNHPVSYSELEENLWYIPLEKIKAILVTTPGIVNVAPESYFFATNLPASDAEIQKIAELIHSTLLQRSYISDVELIHLIEKHCPSVIMNTSEYPTWGLRNVLAYILRDRFSFRGAIISGKGEEISMSEVFADFSKQNEHMTLDDLRNFANELNTVIYWDSVYSETVRITQNKFIRKDQVNFEVERIDGVLEGLIPGPYLPIKEINLFLHFPAIGIKWNRFVLESYVANYSKTFRLLHASFSATNCCGAIVRKNSDISDYRSLIVDVLAKNPSWKTKEDALQLLVDYGYQQRRSFSDIENVMAEAASKIAKKEDNKDNLI